MSPGRNWEEGRIPGHIEVNCNSCCLLEVPREEERIFHRKKHEFVKAECENFEMHGSRNDARKFLQKLKRISEGLKAGASHNTQWQYIVHPLQTAAGEKKVRYRRQQKSTWFDGECPQAAIEKNHAYQATLKTASSRADCEKYCEKRREERRLFRRRNQEFVKAECEKI